MLGNYVYDFNISFKDILAILFRKDKKCPECGSKVKIKIESKVVKEGWDISTSINHLDATLVKKHIVKLNYICESCKSIYQARKFW